MEKKKFMVDTNVFVAAFKSGYTTTTKLLLKLLLDPEIELIVDEILLEEYRKWFKFLSLKLPRIREQAEILYSLIQAKVKLEKPKREDIDAVKPYMPETETADVYHAATCLNTGSILITNDKDFQELKRENMIQVWSISETIRKLGISGG